MNIPILYEDQQCLVINKPAGLPVHPAGSIKDQKTLVEILAEQRGQEVFLVHRLDKDTTGCLLIAKSQDACDRLQSQFKSREVRKKYLAICYGIPEKPEAIIEAPVGRSLVNRTKMSLFKTSTSRNAITRYKVLSSADNVSLIECDIETGRTHQIRVHLSSIDHPILGDEKYGTESSKRFSEKLNITSICLHAYEFKFVSLETGDETNITAPIPDDFIALSALFSFHIAL